MAKKWLGRTYKCIYGLSHGDLFKVTEYSPQKIYDHGFCEQYIKGISQYYGEIRLPLKYLEEYYKSCSEKEYQELYNTNQIENIRE